MIALSGRPGPALAHLLAEAGAAGGPGGMTLVLAGGPPVAGEPAAGGAAAGAPARVLVLSRLGAHPDARHPLLRRAWEGEEWARAQAVPVLVLRFAPLVGPAAPFWNRLRTAPALPRGGRQLLNPASERDARETLRRALDGRADWRGWYEVAGPEAWTLAELRDLAAAAGRGADEGAWDPAPGELAEHRLAECGPWSDHFGLRPERVADAVAERVA